ncbi:MAG: hypothetical protein GY710_08430 [Desulfobacteraceae bacterium]|nr:hypothetical protein [Desulfobacteraceae bacterium]
MEIIINISRHCIETASKKKYNSLISQYFNADTTDIEKSIIEKQIMALVYFLENADFSDLRNRYSKAGSLSTISVIIIPENLENMHIKFDTSVFYPVWEQSKK